MSEKQKPDGGPILGTLKNIQPPPNVAARRKIARPVVIVLMILAGLWLVLKPDSSKLDVYRTIEEIQFADPALESCVRIVAEETGWTNAGQFTSLQCNNPTGHGIKNLDGIEHFVVLRDLNLAFNEITDVSKLAGLHRLTQLELSHNRIGTMPVFGSAATLRRLELNHNRLESLDWLTSEHFLILESLSVAHNRISSAEPLAVLTGLRELDLRSNRISDLSPLLQLVNLNMLDVGGNLLDDIGRIDSLTKLRRLFLDKNQLESIGEVVSLELLEQLDIGYNPLQSIDGVSRLFTLQRLDLRHTGISHLDDIYSLGDIEQLELSGNPGLDCGSILKAVQEFGASAVHFDQSCPQ